MPDSLRPENVLPRLRGQLGRDYRFVPECPSTQRLLDGRPAGAVVATDFQSEGRGRLGRRWEAPPGTSLMFSVALEPRVPPDRLPELTLVAGSAVAAAIGELADLPTGMKFPNDVLVRGKKVAGVLAEAGEGRVILGIGVNVRQRADELPADARVPATSLALEGEAEIDRAELLAAILAQLESELGAWEERYRR
jgi:BirA family biotin operon repressor/biotin-[acetyl-CoA-carboxylase] ligase